MADKKVKQEDDGEEIDKNAWMVTFSDLLTLMITFFVLLLSMSAMDDSKLESMFGAFQDALGVLEMGAAVEVSEYDMFSTIDDIYKKFILDRDIIMKLLDKARKDSDGVPLQKLRGSEDFEHVFSMDKRGIVITLSDAILFDVGQTRLSKKAYPLMRKLATYIKGDDMQLSIEGHSDSSSSDKGDVNWVLSTRRAISVMRYFNRVEKIDMSRLTALGYGEFSPLVDNSTAKNRAKNRRVEIIINKSWKKKERA